MNFGFTKIVVLVTVLALYTVPALAIDHDNVDASRPLRFDDAESIGFRERALEFGLSPTWARGSRFRSGLTAEYLNGFALNTYYSVDFDATNERLGRTGIGIFHNLRRETLEKPSVALRFDTYLPTGTDADSRRGIDFRLRGIVSRTVQGSDRIHINADAVVRTSPLDDERTFLPAVTVGYTKPLGYPKRFDRTALAEVSYRAAERAGGVLGVGIGVRQQVTPRSVADIGIQSDIAAKSGANRDYFRLNVGYSTSF